MKGLIKDFTCSFLNLLHFGAGARAFTKINGSGSIRQVKIHVYLKGCLELIILENFILKNFSFLQISGGGKWGGKVNFRGG